MQLLAYQLLRRNRAMPRNRVYLLASSYRSEWERPQYEDCGLASEGRPNTREMRHDEAGRADCIVSHATGNDQCEPRATQHHHLAGRVQDPIVVCDESVDVSPLVEGKQDLPILVTRG
jgi:hypothetical protein